MDARHMGLRAMGELLRMLGGRYMVDGRLGGPTADTAEARKWQHFDRAYAKGSALRDILARRATRRTRSGVASPPIRSLLFLNACFSSARPSRGTNDCTQYTTTAVTNLPENGNITVHDQP
jgi:hypothetical protein